MQTIIEYLKGIGDTFVLFADYLVGFVGDVVEVSELLAYFTRNIPRYFSWLPSEYITLIVLTFGVAVVYRILGRE